MKALIKWFEDLGWLQLIFCIPGLSIAFTIYRLCRSLVSGKVLFIILAILLFFVGWWWMWLLDLITIIFMKKVLWFC